MIAGQDRPFLGFDSLSIIGSPRGPHWRPFLNIASGENQQRRMVPASASRGLPAKGYWRKTATSSLGQCLDSLADIAHERPLGILNNIGFYIPEPSTFRRLDKAGWQRGFDRADLPAKGETTAVRPRNPASVSSRESGIEQIDQSLLPGFNSIH